MMGDEISEVDCALFGALAQMQWQTQGLKPETILFKRGRTMQIKHYGAVIYYQWG